MNHAKLHKPNHPFAKDWPGTPQAICFIVGAVLSLCAAVISIFLDSAALPRFLSSGTLVYLLTPLASFATFVWLSWPRFEKSWVTAILVANIAAAPFYAPYFRT
jgi:hypothetical protein